MKRKLIIVPFITFILLGTSVYGATFTGRVIDADTKEPIEGAVVVAYWMEERGDIAGPSTRLKDVKEILTDKNGKWIINGPEGSRAVNSKLLFTFITRSYYTRQPNFIIFKPSYCSWPKGFSIETCKGKLKPSGNLKVIEGETIEISKLTKRKDRLRSRPGPVTGVGAWKKQKEFIRMLNEERRNLGLKGSYKVFERSKNER